METRYPKDTLTLQIGKGVYGEDIVYYPTVMVGKFNNENCIGVASGVNGGMMAIPPRQI